MTLFRLGKRCGDHVEDGKMISPGATIESARNLEKVFPGKFVKVHPDENDYEIPDEEPNIPSPEAVYDKGEGEDVSESDSPYPVHPEFGIDITSEFPLAEEIEVKVYEKNHWCQIVDETEDGKEIINDKKLRRKNVKTFLETIEIEEDEEDEDLEEEDE